MRDERDQETQAKEAMERKLGFFIGDEQWKDFLLRWGNVEGITEEDLDVAVAEFLEQVNAGVRRHTATQYPELIERLRARLILDAREDLGRLVAKWRVQQFGLPDPPFGAIEEAAAWIEKVSAGELDALPLEARRLGERKMVAWTADHRFSSFREAVTGGCLDGLRLVSEQLAIGLGSSEAEATNYILLGETPSAYLMTTSFVTWGDPGQRRLTLEIRSPLVSEDALVREFRRARRKWFGTRHASHFARRDAKLLQHDAQFADLPPKERVREWNDLCPANERLGKVDSYRKAVKRARDTLLGYSPGEKEGKSFWR
ncbi:MAG: hypothetical protein PHU43_06575 [Candidatus Bipolaricaulis sp.]|nr:hypothetical protein [Candidatus Bipolaricaulis sp.]